MAIKQVSKFIKTRNKVRPAKVEPVVDIVADKKPAAKKNNKQKNEKDMTLEGIERAEALAQNLDAPKEVKVVKKDRGLIERTESSKIVLTEDNRQVLND